MRERSRATAASKEKGRGTLRGAADRVKPGASVTAESVVPTRGGGRRTEGGLWRGMKVTLSIWAHRFKRDPEVSQWEFPIGTRSGGSLLVLVT